ncbi:MAG TPA: hypothetical protein VK694_05685 [Verrucomicrobiae bacterium]|nr:hypothetical protein [Verrucomicrobiae bacterium]
MANGRMLERSPIAENRRAMQDRGVDLRRVEAMALHADLQHQKELAPPVGRTALDGAKIQLPKEEEEQPTEPIDIV